MKPRAININWKKLYIPFIMGVVSLLLGLLFTFWFNRAHVMEGIILIIVGITVTGGFGKTIIEMHLIKKRQEIDTFDGWVFDPKDLGIFEYVDSGFILNSGKESIEKNWDQVETMIAYKQDLVAVDRVCLEVIFLDNTSMIITEETPGFYPFVERTKTIFMDISKTWEMDITIPAFEENLTLVYDRGGRSLKEVLKAVGD